MIQDEILLNEKCSGIFYCENRDNRIPSFIYNSPRKKNKSRAIHSKDLPSSVLKNSTEISLFKVENISITSQSANAEISSSVLIDISLENMSHPNHIVTNCTVTTPTVQVSSEKELFVPESPITSSVANSPHCYNSSLGSCTLILPCTSLLSPSKRSLIGVCEDFRNEGDVSDKIPELTLAVDNLSVDQQATIDDADDDVFSPVIPYVLMNNTLPLDYKIESQSKVITNEEENVLVLSDKNNAEDSKDSLTLTSENFHLEDKISKIIDTLNDTFTITKSNQRKKKKLKYSSKRVLRNMFHTKPEVQNIIHVSQSNHFDSHNRKKSKKVSFIELKKEKRAMCSPYIRNQECHQKLQMTSEKDSASSEQLSRKMQSNFNDCAAKSSLTESNKDSLFKVENISITSQSANSEISGSVLIDISLKNMSHPNHNNKHLETNMSGSKPNELQSLRRSLRPRMTKNDIKVDVKKNKNCTKDIPSSQKKLDKKQKISDILMPKSNVNDENRLQNISCTVKENKISLETCQDLQQPPLFRMTRSKAQAVKQSLNKTALLNDAKNMSKPKTKIVSSVSGSKLDMSKSVLEQVASSPEDIKKSTGAHVEGLLEKKLPSRKLRKRKLVEQDFMKQKVLADQIIPTERGNSTKLIKTGHVTSAEKNNTLLSSVHIDNATASVVRENSFKNAFAQTKKTKVSSLPNIQEPKHLNSTSTRKSSRNKQHTNKETDQNDEKVKLNNNTMKKNVHLSTKSQNNEVDQHVVTNTKQLRKKKQDQNKESVWEDKINPQPLSSEESLKINELRGKIKKKTSKIKTSSVPKTLNIIRKVGENLSLKYVGVHCSIAGGFSNAVSEASNYGARSFGLFLRNGRNWKLNAVDEKEVEKFKKACMEYNYIPKHILPHGSYLMNCGSSNTETLRKSRETLIHELKICEKLGLILYTFHPGSACHGNTVNKCIKTIAESINMAHQETKYVKTVIENMSGQGKTIGGKLEELKAIINLVQDKSRIGVCLDTCHAFAAGFNLTTQKGYEQFMLHFEEIIGLEYLSALHLNDAKEKLGSNLDRHQNIGKGHIGIEGFRYVMNDPRFNELPMILETPLTDYAEEVKILYELESV